MERVKALANKLVTQIAENADKLVLQQTAIQILSELEQAPSIQALPNNVSVILPSVQYQAKSPLIEMVSVPTSNAVPTNVTTVPVVSIPKEVVEQIAMEPIKDLKAAIGINDKFQFIEILFGKDAKAFETSIKTINAFTNYAEAQFWIQHHLRKQYAWLEEDRTVHAFDQLVKRRFS